MITNTVLVVVLLVSCCFARIAHNIQIADGSTPLGPMVGIPYPIGPVKPGIRVATSFTITWPTKIPVDGIVATFVDQNNVVVPATEFENVQLVIIADGEAVRAADKSNIYTPVTLPATAGLLASTGSAKVALVYKGTPTTLSVNINLATTTTSATPAYRTVFTVSTIPFNTTGNGQPFTKTATTTYNKIGSSVVWCIGQAALGVISVELANTNGQVVCKSTPSTLDNSTVQMSAQAGGQLVQGNTYVLTVSYQNNKVYTDCIGNLEMYIVHNKPVTTTASHTSATSSSGPHTSSSGHANSISGPAASSSGYTSGIAAASRFVKEGGGAAPKAKRVTEEEAHIKGFEF